MVLKSDDLFRELFALDGRVALVTGGSKGLGRVMAETLAAAGADVGLCSRNGDESSVAAAAIRAATGRKTLGLAADVSRSADCDRLVAEVSSVLGAIDILVANAGVNIRKPTGDLTETDWEEVLNINLKGAFLAARAVLPAMRQRGWGRIVFMGSMLSHISIAGRAAYASSKAAILGLTRSLALESASDGVCVNAICPGPFRTPMNRQVYENAERNRAFIEKLPIGRWGEPAELRGLALYLASQACAFMTGSSLIIDGGWTAQ